MQHDLLPLFVFGAVLQQHAVHAVGCLRVAFQEQLPVLRRFRFGLSHAARGVGLALRIAGGHRHSRFPDLPHRAQLAQLSRLGVKGFLVRPDQHLRAHAGQGFAVIGQGMFQHHRPFPGLAIVRGVFQRRAPAHQQTVQVVHTVHVLHFPGLSARCTGLERRVSPARKIQCPAFFRFAAPIGLVDSAECPQHLPAVLQNVQISCIHLSTSTVHRPPGDTSGASMRQTPARSRCTAASRWPLLLPHPVPDPPVHTASAHTAG